MANKEGNAIIVKYDNRLNAVNLHGMTGKEMDVFCLMLSKARDKGTQVVHIQASEINSLLHYSAAEQRELLASLLTKIAGATAIMQDDDGNIVGGSIFPYFHIPGKGPASADISVEPRLLYVVNDLRQYTRYEMDEFSSLRTGRAKTLYRLCKQFRTTGVLRLSMEDVRQQFGVPDNYPPKKIMAKIITPSTDEVARFIPGLACVSVTGKGKGKPTIGYRWEFTPESKPEVAIDGPEDNKGTTKIGGTVYDYEQLHFDTTPPAQKKTPPPGMSQATYNKIHCFPEHDYDFAAIERRKLQGK